MKLLRMVSCVWVAGLVLFLAALTVVAQTPVNVSPPTQPTFAGKYQGVVKTATGDAQITLQLADDNGKFSGHLVTPQGQFEIVKGRMADGQLSLDVDPKGPVAKLSIRQRDDKLFAEWTRAGITESFELKKVDELSGDWEAVANVNGQNFPFALTLKIEGDKITGSSASELGDSTISKGILKDGKLNFQLDGSSGTIYMVATLEDGSLVGDFDYNGQLQGRWVAVRHK
ncbi:MAG: hypothetical protein ACMG6H_07740 [Acidobacteriota bacterium]